MDSAATALVRSDRRSSPTRIIHALMTLCFLVSISGCEVPWLAGVRLEADAAAVREVSSIGDVIARTSQELQYERTVQVIQLLIVDVGASSFSEALDVTRDRLQRHGWVDNATSSDGFSMKSPKWKKIIVTATSLNTLEPYHAKSRPDITKAIKESLVGPHVYILIDITQLE
ncbi:hypothetical protein HCN51_19550 [Nonomuraea sp. FMUSA5-5]|uniref:Uncharacterized protein n=1 Tax=Nonomuraea composti TaxID=2720023 RepID=A0ABX1B536_9ACTN|nr:hypothetical protein [Nonomuraea sp. FMUSA5-5]NJP91627.1 hypothetical protein [Nonomuraea sp. FMUSA5-5]